MKNTRIIKLMSVSFIWVLTGCELLPSSKTDSPHITKLNQPICVWSKNEKTDQQSCGLDKWMQVWTHVETLTWPQRKKRIAELSESNSDTLEKVFLSLGKGTPYQDRLRAQIWLEGLMPKFTKPMQQFANVALYRPNKELLEMESALVTLTKTQTQKDKLITKQAEQIEQLLSIEASLINGPKGE